MATSIPDTMLAAELGEYSENPQIHTTHKPVPTPEAGQVLVRIAASPINPSDLAFLRGQYGFKKKLPVIPGFEAGGTVVASGGGWFANYLKGKRVACAASVTGDGTWAEYMVTEARNCLPLKKHLGEEQGSMALINPMTAWAMLDIASSSKAKAIVQNAAAGALGRMIHRLAKKRGMQVINIVRKPEQVEQLKADGAEIVLNQNDGRFERELLVQSKKLGASIAYDAVGGEMTGSLARSLPPGSRIVVYGGLSGEECRFHPGALIFMNQKVEGFWLSTWLGEQKPWSLLRTSGKVQDLIGEELRSEVQSRHTLSEVGQALEEYANNMSGGKVLITPTPQQKS